MDETLSVSSKNLSEAERGALEQAFLSRHGLVTFRGQSYRVTAMDQNYPEGADQEAELSFVLKPASASRDRNERS